MGRFARVMAICVFSKWRPATFLDFVGTSKAKCDVRGSRGRPVSTSVPNSVFAGFAGESSSNESGVVMSIFASLLSISSELSHTRPRSLYCFVSFAEFLACVSSKSRYPELHVCCTSTVHWALQLPMIINCSREMQWRWNEINIAGARRGLRAEARRSQKGWAEAPDAWRRGLSPLPISYRVCGSAVSFDPSGFRGEDPAAKNLRAFWVLRVSCPAVLLSKTVCVNTGWAKKSKPR